MTVATSTFSRDNDARFQRPRNRLFSWRRTLLFYGGDEHIVVDDLRTPSDEERAIVWQRGADKKIPTQVAQDKLKYASVGSCERSNKPALASSVNSRCMFWKISPHFTTILVFKFHRLKSPMESLVGIFICHTKSITSMLFSGWR